MCHNILLKISTGKELHPDTIPAACGSFTTAKIIDNLPALYRARDDDHGSTKYFDANLLILDQAYIDGVSVAYYGTHYEFNNKICYGQFASTSLVSIYMLYLVM